VAHFEARGLGHRISDRALFDGLDLELHPGQAVALLGPSGVGKSTVLRLLAGLEPVQQGVVQLDGASPDEMGWTTWRTRVALVGAAPENWDGTASELWRDVAGLSVHRGRTLRDPIAIAEPLGLDPAHWQQPWAELSTGERQRVVLAVALALNPDVLLLDEPTGTLDAAARDAVAALLRDWLAGAPRSALVVSHDAAFVSAVASRQAVLKDGALVEEVPA
jgi:ABC-type multidrug transport system ATPase subunit